MDFYAHLIFFEFISVTDSIRLDFTVIQLNTGRNLLHIGFSQILIQVHMIYFLFQILGMSQLGSQVTVVRQQQYSRSITVQTTYRIDTFVASAFHQIHYSTTRLRIIGSCHRIFRFVQQNIYLTFDADRLIVELHFIATLNLSTQFRNHLSVYRHYTGCNKLIRFTTRAHTGISQELIQTNRFVRVDKLFLILYLFLLAVLGIGIVIPRTANRAAVTIPVAIRALRTVAIRVIARTERTVATGIVTVRTLRTVAAFAVITGTVRTVTTGIVAVRTLRTVTTGIIAVRTLGTVAAFAVIAGTVRTVTAGIITVRALGAVAAFTVIAGTVRTIGIIRTLRAVAILRIRIKTRTVRAVTAVRTLRTIAVFTIKFRTIRAVPIFTVIRRAAIASLSVKLVTITAGA